MHTPIPLYLILFAEAQSRFGFKAYGGLAYIGGGDLNKGAQGYGETWYAIFDDLGLNPEDNVRQAKVDFKGMPFFYGGISGSRRQL